MLTATLLVFCCLSCVCPSFARATPVDSIRAKRVAFVNIADTPARRSSSSRRRPRLNSRTCKMSVASGTAADWPRDRLSEYMGRDSGLVDYNKMAAQEDEWLIPMLDRIKETDPRKLDKAERHAFLINAYNLWTIFWVIRERRWPWWKGHTSKFDQARFFYWRGIKTGAGRRNLYNFENKDIRPEVNDARVHFALNCASMSCPPLRRSLFTAAGLHDELDEVSDSGSLSVNPIFKWYKDDFDKEGGALAFIRRYWKGTTPIAEDACVEFFKYDWRVNSIDATWAARALGGPAP